MKYVLLTDIHFGNHGNKDEFNEQCLTFLSFVEKYVEEKIVNLYGEDNYGGAIFLGDWFHNRNNINVKTLKAGVEGLYTLGSIGWGKTIMLIGNHDLYYLDKRDVNSIVVPEGEIGVEVINEPIYDEEKGFLYLPWLVKEEKLQDFIKEYNPKYVFCHAEIPSFSFNRLIKMDGEYNPTDYNGPLRILSGHFHMRQEKNNITYIGNCFSHDFSDVNDWDNKGFAILDTSSNTIEYVVWEDAPKYCTTNISQLNNIELPNNLHLKLINDVGLKQFEVNQLKEDLEKLPNVIDCYVYPNELEVAKSIAKEKELEKIVDIDSLIVSLINDMNTTNIDNQKLVKIYRNL